LSALRQKLYGEFPHFGALDQIVPAEAGPAVAALAGLGGAGLGGAGLGGAGFGGEGSRHPFVSPIGDFYLTNPIARASGVMAECSALAREMRLEAAE
jgi:NADH-quinone oxidoreductase subunit G